MHVITVCMGSSCFNRGNSTNTQIIQRFITENNLTDSVKLSGHLCENECKNGPNITIDDKLYSFVSEEKLEEILYKVLLSGSNDE